MAKNAVVMKNVTKHYAGTEKGISNVSLEVEAGEIFGFLGPNGAGKTTVIRCLMNFIHPQTGSIKIFGTDIKLNPVKAMADIGFLAADAQLYPKWTGNDYLDFLETIRGKSDMSEMIRLLDIDLNVQFRHLSTGNKQKLAFLVAMYGSPKLVILDEPTKGLDPLLQQVIYEILKKYKKSGGTVLLSSHNLPEVEKICDRVGVIKDGKIVAEESIHGIKKMAIHEVYISSLQNIDESDFKFDGVEILHNSGKMLELKIKGNLDLVVNSLSKYKLSDLQINHANLEDVFMEYYR